jgi:hypothetical protein
MRVGSWMVLAAMLGACSSSNQTPDSGLTDASSGTVTFHVVVPGSESFCDQLESCDNGYGHIRITTAAGQVLPMPLSSSLSASCSSNVCQGIFNNFNCYAQGVAVTSGDHDWAGQYQVPSACGADCLVRTYAPPGQYVAQLCATPGALTPVDGGSLPNLATCTATGPEECGPIVPFTFPSATPVELPLGAADGG